MGSRSSIPDSLKDPGLAELWYRVRHRLDKFGTERRGRIKLPPLSDSAALTLSSLLNTKLKSTIDLTDLEQALLAQGVGADLAGALEVLGAPASASHLASRLAAKQRQQARASVNELIAPWRKSWVDDWADWLFRSGSMANADAAIATHRVAEVRRLLEYCQSVQVPIARNDLAVNLYGSAHALDDGCTLERCARRALWHTLNQSPDYHQGRAVWNAAGIFTDSVSTPVLTWQLQLQAATALGNVCEAANAAGMPLHLSLLALANNPVHCATKRRPVLLVENPRIVEAAAQRELQQTVIATNGNPSTAVLILVRSIIEQGVEVYYHGDFDSAGLAICKRMVEMGCIAWRMTVQDYEYALQKAAELGVKLPVDDIPCGETPWDIGLQQHMLLHRRVVHEEMLIDELLRFGSSAE